MRFISSVTKTIALALTLLVSFNGLAQCPDSILYKYALHPTPGVSVYDAAMQAFRCFTHSAGSQVAAPAATRPVITVETFSPTLLGSAVATRDSRIRYVGGHTIESFANIQPGSYPIDLFTSAKNVSFSATERSAIGAVVEFDITCPRFEILEYENGSGVRVLVDNKVAGAYSYRPSGDLSYRLFDFSLINPNPVKRHIRLEYSGKSTMGGLQLDTIGTLLPLQDNIDYRICWLGDSFTEGTGVASNQTLHDGVAAYASKILGFRDYRMSGFGGTGYHAAFNPGFGATRPSLADRVQYDGVDADVYIVAAGLNDLDNDQGLAEKINATLDTLRFANPSSLIFVLGPYGNGIGENIKPVVQQKIIDATAHRPGMQYIGVSDIIFSKSDGTHPDAAGHKTLGAAIAARILAEVDAVDSTPPSCTSQLSPLNRSILSSSTTARFKWTAAASTAGTLGTLYDLYLWPANGPVATTASKSNIVGTAVDINTLSPDSTYKWYVVAKNAAGSASGCNTEAFIFTTASATVPACVANTLPAAGTTLNTQTTATLSWPAAADATSYDVYLSAGSGTPTVLLTNTTALTYTATGLTAGTLYSWYVAPRNITGVDSLCAASRTTSFTTAAVISIPACVVNTLPANNTVLPSQTSARLVWPASAGAISYDVYLAAGAGVPTLLKTTTTSLNYYATGLIPGTLYSWYVAPKNSSGVNTNCAAANKTTFTTAAATSGANQPPVAIGGPTITITLPVSSTTLDATASYDPEGSIAEYYWYQVQGPVNANYNNFSATPTVTGLTTAGTYIFGLQVKDNSGVNSYSGVTVVVNPATSVPAPACVTNTSPAAGTTLGTQTTATLTWPSAATATSYDVYLSAGSTTPNVLLTNTTATSYNVTGLTAGTVYSWYVAPRNASDVNTSCAVANTTSFTTAAPAVILPACVTNTSPAAGTILTTQTTATLNWPASANATSYDIYLSAGSATPTVLLTNTTTLTYNVTGLIAGTLYSWYVAPRNASGVNTGCAAANTTSFTTAAPAVILPACVTNTSPAAGTVLTTQTTATLNWPASANATSYDIYLSAGSATPTVLLTNTTALTYNVTGLTAGTLYSWYVAPRNASGVNAGCAAANTTSFTTAAAAITLPACVTDSLPVNNALLPSQTSARLVWPAAAGAISYDVYLATGTGVPTILKANTSALSYNATGLLPGTLYSWYVAPRNASGVNTSCAVANKTTFTTAAATTGANQPPVAIGGPTITITLPVSSTTLDGTASYDPEGSIIEYYWYQVQGPVTATYNNFGATPTITGLTTAGTYIFGLQVKDNSGVNSYSGVTVVVNPAASVPAPACVTNTSPAAGTILGTQTTATLTWPATATAVSYDIYLSAGGTTPTVLLTNTTATSYNVTGLTAGTLYSWYVAPRNASGVNAGCAATNTTSFTTALPAVILPACVINTSPAAGTILSTQTTATLNWPASANATSYDVYLSAGSATPTVLLTNTTAISYNATGLTAGTLYSWYVAPRNASGVNAGCAAANTTSFTTAAAAITLPACVTDSLPVNNAVLPSQTSARLVWPAAAGAISYDVYLAAGAGIPTILKTNTSALSYNATGLLPGTLYSWYVAPRNASGVNTNCAVANKTTFTTAAATTGANQPPVAIGGPTITITLPVSSTTLDGTASYDPEGSIVEYYWYQVQGPVTATYNNFGATPTITGLTTAGTYIFGLQVKDNSGVNSYSGVTVVVNPANGSSSGARLTQELTMATTDSLRAVQLPVASLTASFNPNPVQTGQQANLLINSTAPGSAIITIINSTGNKLLLTRLNLLRGLNRSTINTAGFAQGLYLINITSGNRSVTTKLIIQ